MTSRTLRWPPGSMTSSRLTWKTLPLKTTLEETTCVFFVALTSFVLVTLAVFEVFADGVDFCTMKLRYHPASTRLVSASKAESRRTVCEAGCGPKRQHLHG